MAHSVIFNNKTPKSWMEAVPVGNGRMGATLMCGVACEELRLNEESIWSKGDGGKVNPKMKEKLDEIRKLFLAGKPVEANALASASSSDLFSRVRSFEGAGMLRIGMHNTDYARDYAHSLDLINGVAAVTYNQNGTSYRRECFASYPDDVMVYTIASDKAPLHIRIAYDRMGIIKRVAEGDRMDVVAHTNFGNFKFCVGVKVVSDGKVFADGEDLVVENAHSVAILIVINTEFKLGDDFEKITFPDKTLDQLKKTHTEDFSAIMNRADIQLPENPEIECIPMSERMDLHHFNRVPDHEFMILQWQFGRYQLASSSRPGSLPANLQGIWSEGNACPWSGDYHFNINLQANYWAAETVNMSDCHMPVMEYLTKYVADSGRKTAREGYGVRGCVFHHLSDIYGFTTPADGLHGLWAHGGSWMSMHFWEHYLYTLDKTYLKDVAYPFMFDCALFYLDYMIEDDKGQLLFGPSMSPENKYYAYDEQGNKESCFLTMSSAMDTGLIRGLFNSVLEAAEILGVENEDTDAMRRALTKMPQLSVGKHGQLMEWLEDYEEFDPGHRHLSPAVSLYPGNLINRSTPELIDAVKTMLYRRTKYDKGPYGAGSVGWTQVWMAAMYARLGMGDRAREILNNYQNHNIRSNMWDVIFSGYGMDVFQIDGNLGFTAAVSEMMIQSHEGTVHLIPALFNQWHTGSFRGLRARGNFTVDCAWKDHNVESFAVEGQGTCVIELPASQKAMTFADETGKTYTAVNGCITVQLRGKSSFTAI